MVSAKRRLIYVSTAIAAAVILILAVILLQQPIQPKTQPPPTKTAPTVATAAATGIGETTATLNGNLGNLGTASHSFVGFVYGTDVGLAGATNVTTGNKSAAVAFASDLTALTSGTAYYFKAWALGDGFTLGSVRTFTTLTPSGPQPHAPAVATYAASGVTSTDATLNGNLSDLGSAASVTIGFRFGTSPTLASATNLSLGARSAIGTFEDGIADLKPNTTYYVQAWGAGEGFTSGTIVNFTTAATTPGNGHRVPPGWAHAACPHIPDQAMGHGVRARCEHNMTYGEWKKQQSSGASSVHMPQPFSHAAIYRNSDSTTSTAWTAHVSESARAW